MDIISSQHSTGQWPSCGLCNKWQH